MSDSKAGSVNPSHVRNSDFAVGTSEQAAGRQSTAMTWRQLVGLLAVVAFSIVLRWRIASVPLERDEGEYAYIAQRWLAGDVPYRDAFDQKPPGVFLAYAALFAVGFRSIEAIHWLGHASLVGAIVFVYLIGRRLWSHHVGCLAALCTVVLVMDAPVLGNASNTEVFAIFPLSACMFFSLRAADEGRTRDGLLAGVAGGVALCFKQVCLPIVAFQFMWMVVARVWSRRNAASSGNATENAPGELGASGGRPLTALVAAFVVGAGAVLLATCAYFAAKGAWRPFYDCVIAHNLAYSARIPLWVYGKNLQDAFSSVWLSQWPIWLAAGVGAGLLARSNFVPLSPASTNGDVRRPRRELFGLCVAWWFGSMVGVSVGGFYREHYFILLMPPTALMAASGLAVVAQLLEQKRVEWQGPIAVAMTLLVVACVLWSQREYYTSSDPNHVARLLYGPNPFVESPAVGRLLREGSTPEDRVFIYGSEPQILFYAERASASRYIYVYPLFAPDRDAAARQRSVLDELRRQPPKFVIVVGVPTSFLRDENAPTVLNDELFAMLNESYRPIANSVFAIGGTFRIVRADISPDHDRLLARNEVATLAVWERE